MIGSDADRVKAIGLSATPFELHSLQRVWTVFQRLGPDLSGVQRLRWATDRSICPHSATGHAVDVQCGHSI